MSHSFYILGPVVQSIFSLTKSLVNDSPHIFSAKYGSVFMYNMFEILTSR